MDFVSQYRHFSKTFFTFKILYSLRYTGKYNFI
jgi:hypothetical protein